MPSPPPPLTAASSRLPTEFSSLPEAEERQASVGVTSVPQLHAAKQHGVIQVQEELHASNDANEAPPGASGPLLPAIRPLPGLSRPLPTPLEPALNLHAPPLAAQKALRVRTKQCLLCDQLPTHQLLTHQLPTHQLHRHQLHSQPSPSGS